MGAIGHAMTRWRRSSAIAAQQTVLAECPCCFAPEAQYLFDCNDLTSHVFVDRRLARGRYSLCHTCGTIFAALRPKVEAAESYYALFSELESKNHHIYPPPSRNSKGKLAAAIAMIAHLEARGLLKPDLALLHVRCDAGTLLRLLRERLPHATLHGLDYFDTNIRWVQEQGFASAALLRAGGIEPADASYDVIAANHHFTHSLDPRGDMARLQRSLRKGGHLLLYHEVDHAMLLDPASEHFTRFDVINFHKQLFVRESFEAFLKHSGLGFEHIGSRGSTMTYMAAPPDSYAASGVMAVGADLLDRERRLIANWQRVVKRYRYPLVAAQALRPWVKRTRSWLERINRQRPASSKPRKA